jgi:hypothetical protein
MAGRIRAVSPTGAGLPTSTNPYVKELTPAGGVYWINPSDPGYGYIVDPYANPGAVAYPLDYINWLLRPSPPTAAEVNASSAGDARLIGGMALSGKIGLLYGQRWIAPSVFFGPRTYLNTQTIAIGYGLSHGPCDSLLDARFRNGRTLALNLASGKYHQTFYPGSLTPAAADPVFAAAAGESTVTFERYPGLCYVSAYAEWDDGLSAWVDLGEPFPIPEFLLKGRQVRNYQTGLDAWTDNPSYCLADYITSKQYGRGANVNVSSVINVAGECDTLVLNSATGQNVKRHTLNLFLIRPANHKSHIDAMRAHFRCTVIERGGEFVFLYDKDKAPSILLDPTNCIPVSLERLGGSGIPNQVSVTIPNSSNSDDPLPMYARTSGVEAGTEIVKPADYVLDGASDEFHGASEAYYLLNTRLNNLRVVLRSPHPDAGRLEPLDVVQYSTNEFGMTNFLLRVLRNTRSADGASHLLETVGHDPAVYNFQARAIETYPLPSIPAVQPSFSSMMLTNPATAVQTEPDGSLPDLSKAFGNVVVLNKSSADVTSGATFGAAVATGCTGTVNTAANVPVAGKPIGYYQVTAMTADTATLDIPVTYGSATITLRFNLTKVRAGSGYTLIPRRNGVVLNHTSLITKTSTGVWDGDVRSVESYTSGMFVSFVPNNGSVAPVFVGFNTDPLTVADWTRIDYAWHCSSDGNAYSSESGALVGYGPYTAATKLLLTYDGVMVRWYKDGVLMRSTARPVGLPLFLDVCMQAWLVGTPTVTNLNFGPMGGAGASQWTPILAGPMVQDGPSSFHKASTAAAAWDAGVSSAESYDRGAYVSFKSVDNPAADIHITVGLDTTAQTDPNNMDYAWILAKPLFGGVAIIIENGAQPLNTSYAIGDEFAISYDGSVVRYYKNGVVVRSIGRAVGSPLKLVIGSNDPATRTQISGVTFGSMGPQGAPATAAIAEKNSLAGLGGNLLIAASSKLMVDMAAGAATITVKDNVLANGDRIVLRKVVAGAAQTEFMAVTSVASGAGPYTYNVTRNLSGAGAFAWTTDDPVTSLGQTGTFFIDAYSLAGLKSSSEVGPTMVGNVRNSATYNDWTPRWAIGNLNGLYGYASNIFGVALGVPTGAWVKVDPTNGVRIGFNATTKVQIDASGNATFTGGITADNGSIGGWTIGAVELVGSGNAAIRAGQSGYDSGSGFYLGITGGGTKFSIGSSGGNKLTWDGANLTLKGDLEIGSGVRLYNNGVLCGSIALISGNPVFQSSAGNGGYVYCSSGNVVEVGGQLGSGFQFNVSGGYANALHYRVNGTQVVGAQGAAVADASATVASVQAQLNALLARLRTHGLIAP